MAQLLFSRPCHIYSERVGIQLPNAAYDTLLTLQPLVPVSLAQRGTPVQVLQGAAVRIGALLHGRVENIQGRVESNSLGSALQTALAANEAGLDYYLGVFKEYNQALVYGKMEMPAPLDKIDFTAQRAPIFFPTNLFASSWGEEQKSALRAQAKTLSVPTHGLLDRDLYIAMADEVTALLATLPRAALDTLSPIHDAVLRIIAHANRHGDMLISIASAMPAIGALIECRATATTDIAALVTAPWGLYPDVLLPLETLDLPPALKKHFRLRAEHAPRYLGEIALCREEELLELVEHKKKRSQAAKLKQVLADHGLSLGMPFNKDVIRAEGDRRTPPKQKEEPQRQRASAWSGGNS